MDISVEMNGEDVTQRLMDGETVYFIPQPEPFAQPEPMAEWPEGWQVMGMVEE